MAAALAWAAVDVAQAASTSGGIGIVRLAALTLVLYALLGVIGGLLAPPLLRRVSSRLGGAGSILPLAASGFGLLLAGGYVNIAFLPSPLHLISIVANAALLVVAIAAWRLASRWSLAARLEGSALGAVVLAVVSVAAAVMVAMPPAAATSAAGARASAPPALPSVFMIVLDSVRVDRTSLGGRGDALMPNFEAFLSHATGFSRAYAQSSWTKPSVGSIFTSLYPSSHGATLRTGRLAADATTLPELFADAGYATAVFSSNPWVSPAFGFDAGVGTFVESERESFTRLIIVHRLLTMAGKPLPGNPARTALQQLERAFGVSEEHRSNCLRDEWLVDQLGHWLDGLGHGPYFAYLHLMSPHLPYDPPGVAHEDFTNDEQVALQRVTSELPEAKRARLVELYEQATRHGDTMLGRILATLEEHHLADSSLILVTADHGEEFHEHGAWGHGNSLHEETVRVPLAVRSPGLAPGRVDVPVMLVDLLPSLAALVSGKTATRALPQVEGADLHAPAAERPIYSELTREGGYESYMLLRDSHKYIETRPSLGAGLEQELFDLQSDPGETRSQWSKDQAAWMTALAALRDRALAHRFEGGNAQIDEEADKRLRALGYLN